MSGHYLSTPLRRALEKSIRSARHVAEDGARDAIRRLGVTDPKPPAYLGDREKDLRRRLRAHARALGDAFDKASDKQETRKLVEATAYAHWHRMLFARFLAERNLLRHPTLNAPITIEECRELAAEEGLQDAWAVAERYAAAMLPAVFRIDDPVLLLELDPAHTQKLTALVTGLDGDTFQAEDSLGWTYQYWRAAEKEAVNESGVKIGADELPAVTQLFTEPYMVRFLLHNTLGAWWAGKRLAANPKLAATARDENELRAACSLPTYTFDMLRFVREGKEGPWQPAAGTYAGWPAKASDLTMLDPCCGSGHFLTETLTALTAIRQHEESLPATEAVAAVLRDNLHGLEIDGRCVQIAAFAVALTAWRLGAWQALPVPHIAWVGAPPPLTKSDFVSLAGDAPELTGALGALHDLFRQAPILGSLLQPTGGDLVDPIRIAHLERLLEPVLAKVRTNHPEELEGAIAARGMADAASILAGRYCFQATNVPFLGRAEQGADLAAFIDKHYPRSKHCLSTVMLERMFKMSAKGGTVATVTKQEWCFLVSYTDFRRDFLGHFSLDLLATLGEEAWVTFNKRGPLATLTSWTNTSPVEVTKHIALDATHLDTIAGKEQHLLQGRPTTILQTQQATNPDSRLTTEITKSAALLSAYAHAYQGISTGDVDRLKRYFWELKELGEKWKFFRGTVSADTHFAGCECVVNWGQSGAHFAAMRGEPCFGKRGVAISQMRHLPTSLYLGEPFDGNVSALIPFEAEHLPAIWCYCSSTEYKLELRKIDKKKNVTNATLAKVPFELARWQAIAAEKYPDGLPEPSSYAPDQWLFHGSSKASREEAALHVALARLCGYQWPAERDPNLRLSEDARAIVSGIQVPLTRNAGGLLSLSSLSGEPSLAELLRSQLAAVFKNKWSDALERRLVMKADEAWDNKAAKDTSLETWLKDRAFRQHCVLFQHRPFLWHIWDGLKDGFSVFVHYHRFDQAALRKLTYTVLGDWLARAKHENNDMRYEKGRELQQKLEKILEGEKPYDIFVRWKSLAEQPLGWDPDLDDGVRLNIRPFVEAGVLRDTPKIKWTKDRGSDVASAPWYDLGPKLGGKPGDRINDHHTTLAEKRAAREAAKAGGKP